MPVKVKPTSVIITKLGLEPDGSVMRFFQDTCYKAMDKFVPKDKGNLRTIVDLSNPSYIVYESPYARYQYYGIRDDGTHEVQYYTTDGTGTYWDKKMWSARKSDIIRQVQNKVNRGGR